MIAILAAVLTRWVGADLARVLAPLVLVGAVLGTLAGAWALHQWQAGRIVAQAVDAAMAEAVSVAEIEAARATADRLADQLDAERRAGAALRASAAASDAEAATLLSELNRYVKDHPDAPADCRVGPDLLRLLR